MVKKSRTSQYHSSVILRHIYVYDRQVSFVAQRKRKIVGLCFGLKQVLVDATISMAFTIFSFSFFVFSLTSQRPNKEKDIVVDFIKTNI